MDKPADKKQGSWQPFTARGVAAFAEASFSRVFLVQLVFAFVAAGCVMWFMHRAWFPVCEAAIRGLPEKAEIRNRQLSWAGPSPACLAENRFLAVGVDLNHEGRARSPADLRVELETSTFKLASLAGFVEARYPQGWRFGLTRAEAEPWWGAWSPVTLALAGGATVLVLLLSWALLALVYMWPAWLAGYFANRQLNLAGSWRLACAALLPGALCLSAAILIYGLGVFDLLSLGFATALHILVGWGYLVAGVWRVPPLAEAAAKGANPFSATGG